MKSAKATSGMINISKSDANWLSCSTVQQPLVVGSIHCLSSQLVAWKMHLIFLFSQRDDRLLLSPTIYATSSSPFLYNDIGRGYLGYGRIKKWLIINPHKNTHPNFGEGGGLNLTVAFFCWIAYLLWSSILIRVTLKIKDLEFCFQT